MECYCYLRNVHDKMADGKTANEKRSGVNVDGPLIPFGAKLSYKPLSSKDEATLHQFVKKMLPRIFMGFVLRAGRMVTKFAHRGSRRLRGPANLRYPRQTFQSTRTSHKKESCRFLVPSELSNS